MVLNGDYLINSKNTLAMRYFYTRDPAGDHAERLPAGHSDQSVLFEYECGSEAHHHRLQYVRERGPRVVPAERRHRSRPQLPPGATQ